MKSLIIIAVILLSSFCVVLSQNQPTEAEIKAEMNRLINSNPELLNDPEKLVETARKNLGIKTKDELDTEKLKDEGITSSVHQKYLNKIVFSNTPIDKKNPNESSFKTNFRLTENIYARVFLPQCLANYDEKPQLADKYVSLYLTVTVSNAYEMNAETKIMEDDARFNTTHGFQIVKVNNSSVAGFAIASSMANILKSKNLPAGTYKVKLSNQRLSISGEFNITFTEAEKQQFIKNYEVDYSKIGSGGASYARIVIDNQSSKTVVLKIENKIDGIQVYSKSKSSEYSASSGAKIYINNVLWYTVSSSDEGKVKVITVK